MENNSYKILNENALIYNITTLKTYGKQICAMVKANAYGHGIGGIAKALKYHADFFGVNNINEALEIRNFDKDTPILIVGKTIEFKTCVLNDISFCVDSIKDIEKINKLSLNKKAKIHICVNTGMNRLGVNSTTEFQKMLIELDTKKGFIEGVGTHFCTLDCDKDFYEFQENKFKEFLRFVDEISPPIIHAGGSEVINFNYRNYDMLRVGLALYGYGKSMRPVMKIISKIIKILDVKKGDRVGYSNGFFVPKDMKIAVVPLGYADGINRKLANNASVSVNGQMCKLIGNICMDMFFVDVTGIEAKIFDKVIVFDNASSFAKLIGTNEYEVLTGFNCIRAESLSIFNLH